MFKFSSKIVMLGEGGGKMTGEYEKLYVLNGGVTLPQD